MKSENHLSALEWQKIELSQNYRKQQQLIILSGSIGPPKIWVWQADPLGNNLLGVYYEIIIWAS